MSQQAVFSCPSCGGTLSVNLGTASTQCQFCGRTVAVPNTLGGQGAPAGGPTGTSYSAPNFGGGASGPGPAIPYYVPMMSPVIPDTNRVFRGIMGLNIAITALVGIFTVCITGIVVLPFILFMVPGLWSSLAQILTQLTRR